MSLMAQQWSETQAVPVLAERSQPQALDVASFGFADWLEQITSEVGKALEKAKEKAKAALEEIEFVGKDAWEKIKETMGEIEVAKEKFLETVLPKILKALKAASASGEAAVEKVILPFVQLLKELGISALEKALSYISSHRADIEEKIYEIITAHLIKAINQVTGLDTFAIPSLDDDKLKLVLHKLLKRCQADDASLDAAVVFALKPFGLQRSVQILEDMKIENPVDSDIIDDLLTRVEAVDGLIQQFGHGDNFFEEILKKIIAKVEEDPVKVARMIESLFRPEVLLVVIHHLKELYAKNPTKSLKTLIDELEKSVVSETENADKMKAFGHKDDIFAGIEATNFKKDLLKELPDLANKALDRLFQRESSMMDVEDKFVKRILPTLISLIQKLANKTSDAAAKVADFLVSLLRRLGSRAIEAAIDYVDSHEAEIGERLHDFLLQRLQDALAEINYVREFGLQQFVTELGRAKQ